MPKTALVLSGGGANGAFQVMAEKYAREQKGYKWDIIAGVSVGAVNATMLALEKYQRLAEIWQTISNDKVYTGSLNFWTAVRLLFGAKSIYSNQPLWRMIETEIDRAQIKTDLRVGVVSLRTGDYSFFNPTDPNFKKALLASTAIPVIWEPVDVSASWLDMVDGGVRNISPLGDVLDADPTEVVVIHCSPRTSPAWGAPFKNVLEIGRQAIEVALAEIFVTDVREFLRINHNVQEAEAHGIKLHNENGKEYKYYDYKIIEPDESLGDIMDFSQPAIAQRMAAGWEKAKQVLG
jgi:NTE family protein